MQQLEEQLKRMNERLGQLLKQYQLLQKENEQLKIPIQELKTNRENDSLHIMQLEQQFGYTNLYNLKGGILAWAEEIDPSLDVY